MSDPFHQTRPDPPYPPDVTAFADEFEAIMADGTHDLAGDRAGAQRPAPPRRAGAGMDARKLERLLRRTGQGLRRAHMHTIFEIAQGVTQDLSRAALEERVANEGFRGRGIR